MMKKTLILSNSANKLKIYPNYMVVSSCQETTIIGYIHIQTLYINKAIPILPSELLRLATFFDVYFIDHHGYILGSIRLGS